jgi:protein-S-isoprenylcysteine O-methyltransferase Ste14
MKSQLNPLYWVDVATYVAFAAYVVMHAEWHARQIAGISIAIVGFALWMTARFQLGGSFTVTAQARKLVTNGLYSKFRNPIYLFGGVAFAGLLIAIGNPIIFLLFLLFYSHQFLRIRKEAKVLEEAFGEDYRRYKAKTWF